MLILVAIPILLLPPLVVMGSRFSNLRSGYIWLVSMSSTFIAWGLIFQSRGKIPFSITLANWQIDNFISVSPILHVDEISWYFALTVVTLTLAVLLTDVARVDKLDPRSWAYSQMLGGVGLIAVIAGNPLTMLMAWALIDIVESVFLLLLVAGSGERERVVISLSVRIGGMLLLISAVLRADSLGMPLTFENIPSEVGGYLLLAGCLRLGILTPYQPRYKEPLLCAGLGTLIRYIPVIAGIVLLVRIGQVGIGNVGISIFMVFTAASAILGAIAWLLATNEIEGRPFWILGMSAFALVSAIQGMVLASIRWGLAMLFSGALLFLFSKRHPRLLILPVLGLVGFSALPLTPSWDGSAIFLALSWPYRAIFSVALAIMMVGYLRFTLKSVSDGNDPEPWMWIVYSFGLILLLLTHYGLIYSMWTQGKQAISFLSPWWWAGLIPLGLAILLISLSHRQFVLANSLFNRINNTINRGYRYFWWTYRTFSKSLYLVTRLLEGEGSVLWILLILILLVVTLNLWGSGYAFEP